MDGGGGGQSEAKKIKEELFKVIRTKAIIEAMEVGYRADSSLLRPPSQEFHCSEGTATTTTRQNQSITFQCALPKEDDDEVSPSRPKFLTFSCREPSYGVLTDDETMVLSAAADTESQAEKDGKDDGSSHIINGDDDDYDDYSKAAMSCMLFEEETYPYALAGKTGFQVWPGTRLAVDALIFPRAGDTVSLQKWQREINVKHRGTATNNDSEQGFRILELGAGVGAVGASLAIMGAQVLLTDLADLVKDSLYPNLLQNSNHNNIHQQKCNMSSDENDSCPDWLGQSQSYPAVAVGKGWVAATALDWNKPLEDQLSPEQCHVDLIVACDCVWLISMLQGLFSTAAAIFKSSKTNSDLKSRRIPRLLLSFQRRDSDMFTTVDRVLDEIKAHNWSVECLAWYPVTYEEDGESKSEKEVFLFEISPEYRCGQNYDS